MWKLTLMLFALGICIALGLAAYQYSVAPQGILLYTPAPGAKPNYTSSSQLGFFVVSLALCFISGIATLLMFFGRIIYERIPRGYIVQSLYLTLSFGGLCMISLITEKIWP